MTEPLIYINMGLSGAIIFAAGMLYMRVMTHGDDIQKLKEKANHLSELERLTDVVQLQHEEIERLRTRIDRISDLPRSLLLPGASFTYEGKEGC